LRGGPNILAFAPETEQGIQPLLYNVIVVGGSYAGMAAALQVARARRQVLVIDSGLRRNRFASHAHGFLGQDGTPPQEIAAGARAQLLAYPNVAWIDGAAVNAGDDGGSFSVEIEGGTRRQGRRLVIATGVVDTLPDVPGLAERWGTAVFHCPYCHGYELDRGTAGVLAYHPGSVHQAEVVADWGSTMFFTNGAGLDDEQAAALARRGVAVESEKVVEIAGAGPDIHLADGRVVSLVGLYVVSQTSVAGPIAHQLGCAFDDGMTGPIIRTDATKQTTVAGVFACGDAARSSGSVATAVGDGTAAGTAAHQSLIFDRALC